MLEFMQAAFPWVMLGLAILFVSTYGTNLKTEHGEIKQSTSTYTRVGIGIMCGLTFGVILNTTGISLVTYACIGGLLGLINNKEEEK